MSLEFRDDVGQHEYWLDGVRVPSVTGILKASGLINFDGIPIGTLEAARERGTIVHQAIAFLNDRDLDLEQFRSDFPSLSGYVDAWLSFCDQRHFVPTFTEYRVASRRYQVAGTLDAMGTIDDVPVLLDYASGRAVDACKQLQTSAYEVLAREWAADDPALAAFFAAHPFIKRYAVELRRDGTFKLEAYTAPSDAREFLALVTARQIVAKYRAIEVAA